MQLRRWILLGALWTFTLVAVAEAAPRRVPRYGGRTGAAPAEKSEDRTVSAARPAPAGEGVRRGEVTPALALANMIYFEYAQGIHDYRAEVLETSNDLRSGDTTTTRKLMFYLAPATTLTLLDGEPLNFLSADLFRQFLDGVELAFEKEEEVRGVPCYVVRVTPKEGAFRENIKHYYLAKEDFRKMRIRAIKTDSDLRKFWFINDFHYKTHPGGWLLPHNTQAQLLTWEEIPVNQTQAVFLKYEVNKGLQESFFDRYVQDKKFNDTFKD